MTTFTPKKDPDGTLSPLEHERQFLKNAELLEDRGRRLLERDGRIDVSTGNQCFVSATKLRQSAAELAIARIDRDRSEWLLNEWKRMKGAGYPVPRKLKRTTDR